MSFPDELKDGLHSEHSEDPTQYSENLSDATNFIKMLEAFPIDAESKYLNTSQWIHNQWHNPIYGYSVLASIDYEDRRISNSLLKDILHFESKGAKFFRLTDVLV